MEVTFSTMEKLARLSEVEPQLAKQLIKDDSIMLEEKVAAGGGYVAEASHDLGDSRMTESKPARGFATGRAINQPSGDDLHAGQISEQELPARRFRRGKKQSVQQLAEQQLLTQPKEWERQRALHPSQSLQAQPPAFGKRNFSLQPGTNMKMRVGDSRPSHSKLQDSSTASLRQPPALFIKKRAGGKKSARQGASVSNATGTTSHHQTAQQARQDQPTSVHQTVERTSQPDKVTSSLYDGGSNIPSAITPRLVGVGTGLSGVGKDPGHQTHTPLMASHPLGPIAEATARERSQN